MAFSFQINLEALCHKIRNVNSSVDKRRLRPHSCFINQFLAMSCDGGYSHVHFLSTSCYIVSTEASAMFMLYMNRLPPWPLMVARDDDHIFPNKYDPFDWFIPNLLDGLAGGAISTTPRVIALGVALFSAISTAVMRRCSCSLPTNSIRSIGFYLTCWTRSHEERSRLHLESLHSG
jgi:hypothetical protein